MHVPLEEIAVLDVAGQDLEKTAAHERVGGAAEDPRRRGIRVIPDEVHDRAVLATLAAQDRERVEGEVLGHPEAQLAPA